MTDREKLEKVLTEIGIPYDSYTHSIEIAVNSENPDEKVVGSDWVSNDIEFDENGKFKIWEITT